MPGSPGALPPAYRSVEHKGLISGLAALLGRSRSATADKDAAARAMGR
jgi:hypothetical protein